MYKINFGNGAVALIKGLKKIYFEVEELFHVTSYFKLTDQGYLMSRKK